MDQSGGHDGLSASGEAPSPAILSVRRNQPELDGGTRSSVIGKIITVTANKTRTPGSSTLDIGGVHAKYRMSNFPKNFDMLVFAAVQAA